MRRIFIIQILLLLTVVLTKIFATSQTPDILIYKGDTLSLFANPLEQLYGNDSTRPKYFGKREACMNTACWRGYQAEWKIIDNQLYLTGIYSCCYYEDKIKADLTELFGNKCINGTVKADWVTGKLIVPKGKLIYYIHMGYDSFYESELEFEFAKGQLIETKTYDNSKSRLSIYSKNEEKLKEFIYSNINWTDLPKTDKLVKVIISFAANEKGFVDDVKVMRGYDSIYDKEAVRVVKAIPEWDVFFRRGKLEKAYWTLPVIFSAENKEKYKK